MSENYYIRNKETGKIELHFDKETYMSLPDSDKQKIKSNFLFGRKTGAWISRCKFPNLYRAEEVAKALGLENRGVEGESLTFAERKNRIRQRAEINRRTQYYMQQKLFGVVFILFAVALFVISHNNDIPELLLIGVISFAVGLYVVMTKHMIFVNSYWLEKLENNDLI